MTELETLDDDLQQLQESFGEIEAPAPLDPAQELEQDLMRLFNGREDRPTVDQITAWKDKFGNEAIQLLALDQDNVFVYTHITLAQWEKIQGIMQQAAQQGKGQEAQALVQRAVLKSAVLWPKLDDKFFEECRAGLPDTMHQLILIHSYFLTPQQAMSLTIQL